MDALFDVSFSFHLFLCHDDGVMNSEVLPIRPIWHLVQFAFSPNAILFATMHFLLTLYLCVFSIRRSVKQQKKYDDPALWSCIPQSDDCQVVGCLENHAMSIQTDEVSDWICCWWDNRVALFGLFFTPLPRTGELHTILNAPHNIRTRLKNFSSKNTWKEEQIWHKKNQWTLSEQWLIFYKFAL